MISMMRNRFLAAFVTFHLVLLVTSPAFAAMIPSTVFSHAGSQEFQKDMDTIQQALENKIVQEKLKSYGFTPDEISSKISSYTPGQIHILAATSEDLLAGGDLLATITFYLCIAFICVFLYQWILPTK